MKQCAFTRPRRGDPTQNSWRKVRGVCRCSGRVTNSGGGKSADEHSGAEFVRICFNFMLVLLGEQGDFEMLQIGRG